MTLLSALPHILPSDTATIRRRDKNSKQGISITAPLILSSYNKSMGAIVRSHFHSPFSVHKLSFHQDVSDRYCANIRGHETNLTWTKAVYER